ncbi:hypothetical protein BJF90_16785 [Pseudonocardia sp. CNS-004]|nr:hypothetical protein BJF90_16785 [Pseudonocardia sp. CNS-004]
MNVVGEIAAPVRAEFRKVASTKLWWALLIPVALLSSMINLFGGVFTAAFPEEQLPLLLGSIAYALGMTSVFAAVHGLVAAAGEYRHRTITTTYLTTRGRAPYSWRRCWSAQVSAAATPWRRWSWECSRASPPTRARRSPAPARYWPPP